MSLQSTCPTLCTIGIFAALFAAGCETETVPQEELDEPPAQPIEIPATEPTPQVRAVSDLRAIIGERAQAADIVFYGEVTDIHTEIDGCGIRLGGAHRTPSKPPKKLIRSLISSSVKPSSWASVKNSS